MIIHNIWRLRCTQIRPTAFPALQIAPILPTPPWYLQKCHNSPNCEYLCMYTFVHAFVFHQCTCKSFTYTHAYMYTYMHAYMYTYTHAYIYTYTHAYLYTYTHAYMYTFISTLLYFLCNIYIYIYIYIYIV